MRDKQVKFKNNILKGMSPQQAYEKAGYKARGQVARNAAARLLCTNVYIQEEIKKSRERVTKKIEGTLVDVLNELWAVGSCSAKDFYDNEGKLIPIHKLSPKAAKAVASFEIEEWGRGAGQLKKVKGSFLKKLRTHSKVEALKDLRKHFEGDKLKVTYDLDDWEEYISLLGTKSKALFLKRMEERKRKK